MNLIRKAHADSLEKVAAVLDEGGHPWLVPAAAEWLEDNLDENMIGVEFGGGLSTGWFCRRLKFLHTVECSTNWAVGLINRISGDHSISNKWFLHYINCDWNKDSDGNRWYIKNHHDARPDHELEQMEARLRELQINQKIDFCLVDGSVRYETFLMAKRMLEGNKGAILCVDNTEKPHRAKYVDSEVPKTWKKIEFVNENPHDKVELGSKTTIFVVS